MNIAIAGAGIGGLAAACLLHDRGHDVVVYDRFDTPLPVGSGLVIQPVGLDVLDEIGIGTLVRGGSAEITRMLGHEVETGRPVLDVSYGTRPGLGIHRATLFDALLTAVRARQIPLRTGAEIIGHDKQRLLTPDGPEARADLIVDACGAGSPLSPLVSRPLPYGAIWGTVDWPDQTTLPRGRLTQRYRRADRMIGVLPLGPAPGGHVAQAALFWSLPAGPGYADWTSRGLAGWQREAMALWPEVGPFIGQITDPARMTMARYTHGTLARPWGDGIVHIGDAAHRASPQLGQGANMALLDAAALARALEIGHPGDALRAYALARRWHVRIYQAMSAAFTPQYQSDSRWLPVLRDRVLFPLSRIPPLPRVLSHLVSGTMIPPMASLESHPRHGKD